MEADISISPAGKYATSLTAEPKGRGAGEAAARMMFTLCGWTAAAAVAFIAFYIISNGIPALREAGWRQILLDTVWTPLAGEPRFGILYVALTSLAGTFLAVLIGVPAGVLTAVYLTEYSGRVSGRVVGFAVEILAGIPSVIYGLLGVYLLNPLMYKLERRIFKGSGTHQFTGGANLLSAVIILAVMILPTVISVSAASIRAVRPGLREASLALGASKLQTIFLTVLPAARSGITAAAVLGVARAVGEATAVTLVSGGSVNAPFPFHSVRFLTTAIVSEMGYSQGLHRQALFTIGMVLLGFIMLVNIALRGIMKGIAGENG